MDKSGYKYAVSAAGRVNIIGEHVDYCGGKVFPAALSMRNKVYVRPNGTNFINISWTTLPHKVSLDISKLNEYRRLQYGNYQAGCVMVMREAGYEVVGCDMLQDCTVPFGSGLSSSAAIEVSTIAALAAASGAKITPKEIALLAQKAEHTYAGVNCGIMDQFASACGKRGHAMLLDCSSLECEYVPLELGDYSLVITNSKVPHELIVSKYNERRAETEEALRLLKTKLDVSCLAQVSAAEFERNKHILPEPLCSRAAHVVSECGRVIAAAEAMRRCDMAELGRLMNASHESLRTLYAVTGSALDALAHAAQSHPACAGSRMTGGGFGGCTVSLVRTDGLTAFKKYVSEKYENAESRTAVFYECAIADGLVIEEL